MKKIDSFTGDYRWLSNFYPSPVGYENLMYPSVEHAYQAAKTTIQQQRLLFTNHRLIAGAAKRLGKTLPLRGEWEVIKLGTMETLLRDKFSRHPVLADRLRATGDAELIEGNTWGDRFWGVCEGQGYNWLGTLLMKIRKELRS